MSIQIIVELCHQSFLSFESHLCNIHSFILKCISKDKETEKECENKLIRSHFKLVLEYKRRLFSTDLIFMIIF